LSYGRFPSSCSNLITDYLQRQLEKAQVMVK